MDPALQPLIDDVLSPLVVASFLSFCATGIVLALSAQYFSLFWSKDRPVFIWGVAFLTVFTLVDQACLGSWTFNWAVNGFMNPLLMAELPWEMVAYCFTTGTAVLITQTFYTWRIWVVGQRKNYVLVGFLLGIGFAAFACEMRMMAFCIERTQLADFVEVRGALWAWTSLVLAGDVLITASMWYYIVFKNQKRSGVEVAQSPLMRIIHRCIQTNSLSTLVQILIMILIGVYPNSQIFGIFAWLEVKVYNGSLIATLNARHTAADSLGFDSTSHTAQHTAARGFGAKSTTNGRPNRLGQTSVHVQIEHEVAVEIDDDPAAPMPQKSPYAVKFQKEEAAERGSLSEKGGERFDDVEMERY
ncbi:hypothetical protein JCM6882_004326 [Rhodosporidiobolus microsporus]